MQLKKMLPLFVVLVFVLICIFAFFILRHRSASQDLILGQFAKLPEKPNPIAEFEHGDFIYSVAFSPVDPLLVASAGEDKTVKLWNRNNAGVPEATLTDHTKAVTSIVFSPTGQFLASGSLDGTIILWDVSGKRSIKSLEHRFDGTLSDVNAVSFSPDGKWLVSAGMNVKFWDVTDIHNPVEGRPLSHDNWIKTVDFSPDGRFLAAGDQRGNVKIWDVQNEPTIKKINSRWISTIKFSPDNRLLATSTDFIKLWNVPDWHLHGTIPNFALGLAFSQDGKILAGAGGKATKGGTKMESVMKLWSMENGAHITSLEGHTEFFNAVTFSPDGTVLAGSGDDGIVRVWDVAPYVAPQQLDLSAKVRLIYFVPSNRRPQPNIRGKIDELIKKTQQFYADEMERHGFGRKTFDFEMDENRKAVIYRVDGEFTDDHYFKDTIDKVRAEVEQFDVNSRNVWLIVIDSSREKIDGAAGMGGLITSQSKLAGVQRATRSYALIPASGAGFSLYAMGHELGHAFGLEHDFRSHDLPEGSYIMSYDLVDPYRLSKGAAEWLDQSRLFNRNERFFDSPPTIERLPVPTDGSDTMLLRFKLEDVDGLHQSQLVVPTTEDNRFSIAKHQVALMKPTLKKEIEEMIEKDPKLSKLKVSKLKDILEDPDYWREDWPREQAKDPAFIKGAAWKLHSYQSLESKKTATVEFELAADLVEKIRLQVIDEGGNIAKREFDFTENSEEQPESP